MLQLNIMNNTKKITIQSSGGNSKTYSIRNIYKIGSGKRMGFEYQQKNGKWRGASASKNHRDIISVDGNFNGISRSLGIISWADWQKLKD